MDLYKPSSVMVNNIKDGLYDQFPCKYNQKFNISTIYWEKRSFYGSTNKNPIDLSKYSLMFSRF